MTVHSSTPHNPVAQVPLGNPGRPWIRTTYQLGAAIPITKEHAKTTFNDACACVINWVKDRFPDRPPQAAWDGDSFRLELPGQRIEVVSIPEFGTWSFRLEHPDMPFSGQQAIPGRTWTTDIGFTRGTDEIAVGIRTFCASLPYSSDEPIAMTRPRIVLELAKRFRMRDQRMLSRDAWKLNSDNDLLCLSELLVNKNRKLPVVLLTQPDKSKMHVQVSDYMLDPSNLANRCCGVAHIVQLPWELGYKWTQMIGKQWSVYLGAVRTYHPGFDPDNDSPIHHPSTYAEKILFWKMQGDDRAGELQFTDFLVQRLFESGVFRRIDWKNVIFVPDARTKHAEVMRSNVTNTDELKQLYEIEIDSLNQKVIESEKEAEEWSDDATRTAKERDQYKDENRLLRFQIESLRQALSERSGGTGGDGISIPATYEDLPEWVEKNLAGRVVLHSRAHRGLKDANSLLSAYSVPIFL